MSQEHAGAWRSQAHSQGGRELRYDIGIYCEQCKIVLAQYETVERLDTEAIPPVVEELLRGKLAEHRRYAEAVEHLAGRSGA